MNTRFTSPEKRIHWRGKKLKFSEIMQWIHCAFHGGIVFLAIILILLLPVSLLSQDTFMVDATDGLFEDRVEITWPEVTDNMAARITIERDGQPIVVLAGSETMYNDESGDPGVQYEYCVSISRSDGTTDVAVCDNGSRIIFAPTGFLASDALFEGHVLLTWADRSDVETEYRISRRTLSQGFELIATRPANTIFYEDTTAIVGYDYQYRIVAVDANGFSSLAAFDFGKRASVTPPANVSASDGQYPNFVRISWIDQSEEEDGFKIYRDNVAIATVSANTGIFEDTSAEPEVIYNYCVVSMVNGSESVKICDEGRRGGLTPPENVQASDLTYDDHVLITWRDVANTEDGFEVIRTRVGETNSVVIGTSPANSTQYSDFNALQGVEYNYCVQAFSNADTTTGSYSVTDCDNGIRSNVLAPEDVVATDSLYEDMVEISWSSSSVSAMLFNVYRNGILIKTLPTSKTNFVDKAIASGVTYQYAVSSETVVTASAQQQQEIRAGIEAILLQAEELQNEQAIQFNDGAFGGKNIQQNHLQADAVYRKIKQTVQQSANNTAGLVESDRVPDTGSRKIKKPTSVDATYDTYEDRIEITWTDNSQVEIGFHIYRNNVLVDSVNADRTSYKDYRGQPGVEHSYSVRAFDKLGQSQESVDTGFRKLNQPDGVQATDGENERHIRVTWVDNSRAETGYEVSRNGAIIATTAANTTSYTDSAGIDFGVAYEYSLAAIDDYGSSEVETDSGYTTVLPPSDLNASTTYAEQVTVVWVDVSEIEDAYRLTRKRAAGGSLDKDIVLPANTTSYVDNPVTPDIDYIYAVSAYSTGNQGAIYSKEVMATGRAVGSSGTQTQEQPTKIVPDRAAAVAVSDDYALIGGGGDVRIFQQSADGTWSGNGNLEPTNVFIAPGDYGAAVGLSGEYAVVGAPGNENGAAFFFHRNGNAWNQLGQQFIGNNNTFGERSDNVGQTVAINGNYAIVGAPEYSQNANEGGHGAAYVFQLSQNNWSGQWELGGNEVEQEDRFGSAVAVSSKYAVVGAPQADNFRGRVYIYENENGSWTLKAKDIIPALNRSVGSAVALNGEIFLASATVEGQQGVYVFKRDPLLGWQQQTILLPEEIRRQPSNLFGASVSVLGNYALIGAPGEDENRGAAYFFEMDPDNETWSEPIRVTAAIAGTADAGDQFGKYVSVGPGYYLISAPGDDDDGTNFGAVYSVPFKYIPPVEASPLEPPSEVRASDGRDLSIQIKWKDNATVEEGYRIYRSDSDGNPELIASLPENTEIYNDVEAIAGTAYEYSVTAFIGETTESVPGRDFGWRPPNGSLSGRVAALGGGGTANVEVCLEPSPNRGLLFDGNQGGVAVSSLTTLPAAYTIEFWARRASADGFDIIFSIGQPAQNKNVHMGFINNVFRFGFGGDDLDFNHGNGTEWNHWAVSFAQGNVRRIYRDGVQVSSDAGSIGGDVDGPLQFGSYFNADYSYFSGQLDEVRIWDYARSESEIIATKDLPLNGDEPGLIGYWPLDQGSQRVAADVSQSANHGKLVNGVYWADDGAPINVCAITDIEGNYTLNNLRYGESTKFTVTPSLGVRSFDPAFKTITLKKESPVQNEVDFVDNTAFTVSGRVRYIYTTCPVPDVEIYVDGVAKGKTESDGTFAVSVEPSKDAKDVRRIEPRLVNAQDGSDNHAFIAKDVELVVKNDIRDIIFSDTKTRTLSGFFGGSCGVDIGSADLRIFSENGCFERILKVKGAYKIDLPPEEYLVQVKNVQATNADLRGDIILFFDNLGTRTVDLTSKADTVNFIYRAPLKVAINGIPPTTCDALITVDGQQLPQVPVLEQGVNFPLTISVYEDYGNDVSCPVDTGVVTIFDEIGDKADAPVELAISDGVVLYDLATGLPNIFSGRRVNGIDRSFQKSISVVANVEGRDGFTVTKWVLVTGVRPRTATFVTATSDEHPFFIIQDPPGDGSSAFIEKGTKYCTEWDFNESFLIGVDSEINTKVGFKVLTGLGIAVESQAIAGLNISTGLTAGGIFEKKTHFCLTATERFSTSSDDNFVGADADIIVGAALNFKFAEADELNIDGCNVVVTETLAGGLDDEKPFATTFAYTTQYIRDILIPQLESLIKKEPNSNAAKKFELGIRKWRNFLSENEDARKKTSEQEPTKENNRTFSAGTSYEFTETRDSTWTSLKGAQENIHFNIGKGFVAGSSGNKFLLELKFVSSGSFSQTKTGENGTTASIGYVLEDDDVGDFFTVNVGDFDRYGTKSFALKSGTSSNPFEEGTQPRDRPILIINPPVRTGVPIGQPATFTLSLTNAGESQEPREYILRTLHTSNPGGAILSANGAPIHAGLSFFIGPQQTQEVTLKVDRGPTRYSYEDIGIQLYPPGEYPIWEDGGLNGNGVINQTAVTHFSVFYDAPCSEISILRPLENWQLNAATIGDSLDVILHEFDLNPSESDEVNSIGLEYRIQGSSEWNLAVRAPQTRLNPDAASWSTNWLPPQDGAYEVRAFTECKVGGRVYTEPIVGSVDTKAPQVMGTPQPSDQVLALGDDIAITFDETIDCATVVSDGNNPNVALTHVDGPNAGDSIPNLEIVCDGRTLTISPPAAFDWEQAENLRLEAKLSTSITDNSGNSISKEIRWQFTIRRSALAWRPANLTTDTFIGKGGNISATLVNGRTQLASFELQNLPEWLSPSLTQGDLPPGGERKIDFTVADTLQLGSHDAIVAANTNEGDALLYITINVAEDERPLQNVALVGGWNWFSINREPSNPAVNQMLGNLVSTNSDIIKGQSSFSVYDRTAGGWVGSLNSIEPGKAYLMKSANANMLVVEGAPVDVANTPLSLANGWNWIGYLPQKSVPVNEALASINPVNGDLIKSQTDFAQYSEGTGWVGSLQEMNPGLGYRLFAANGGTLTYPQNSSSNTNLLAGSTHDTFFHSFAKNNISDVTTHRTAGNDKTFVESKWNESDESGESSSTFVEDPVWEFSPKSYANSMTVTAELQLQSDTSDEAFKQLGAFVGEQLRGVAEFRYIKPLDRYLAFLMVYSDEKSGEQIRFRILDDVTGEKHDCTESISFEADARIGTPGKPLVVSLQSEVETEAYAILPGAFMVAQNYPNPFNPTTTIHYELPKASRVIIKLYDILGREVETLLHEAKEPGRYDLVLQASHLATGVYFYRFDAGDFSRVHKLILLK